MPREEKQAKQLAANYNEGRVEHEVEGGGFETSLKKLLLCQNLDEQSLSQGVGRVPSRAVYSICRGPGAGGAASATLQSPPRGSRRDHVRQMSDATSEGGTGPNHSGPGGTC